MIFGARWARYCVRVRSASSGIASRANQVDLFGLLFVGTKHVEDDMADAGGVEFADAFGDHLRRAQGAVALRGFAEIHRVTDAEGFRRAVERFLVGMVEPW